MSLIDRIFNRKTKSAAIARNRLQVIIAQERNNHYANNTPDYLPTLQKELLDLISKYVKIEASNINISREEQNGVGVLEFNITLPENTSEETSSVR